MQLGRDRLPDPMYLTAVVGAGEWGGFFVVHDINNNVQLTCIGYIPERTPLGYE